MKGWRPIILGLMMVLVAISCARFQPPTGGPVDKTPPGIIIEESSPNFQTNFKDRSFEIQFDEWVELKNVNKNIVVSPPLLHLPKVSLDKKKLIFEFDEEEQLLDSVTYQIQFGEAIQDYTNGNKLKNHRFVFSTGDQIDSLEINGQVTNAKDGKAVDNIAVFLYENLSDTMFYTQRPFYFTKTDAKGVFKFENIRKDTFRVFALDDTNLNYYYDGKGETVGFLDSLLVLDDTSTFNIQLEVFKEYLPPKLLSKKHKSGGLVKYLMSEDASDFTANLSIKNIQETVNDTLFVWYDHTELDSFEIIIPDIDTSWIYPKEFADKRTFAKLNGENLLAPLYAKDSISFVTKHAIRSFEQDSIRLIDTVGNATITDIYTLNRRLIIKADLNDTSKYEILFSPNAITDWYDKTNDTTKVKFSTIDSEVLGNIILSFEGQIEGLQYLLKLKKGEKIIEEAIVDISTQSLRFDHLKKGDYALEIIVDQNKNNRWDPGNIKEKRQSETIFNVTLEALRPGWDLESTVNLTPKE